MSHRLYRLCVFAGLIVPGTASADVMRLSHQAGATGALRFLTPRIQFLDRNTGSTLATWRQGADGDAWSTSNPTSATTGSPVGLTGDNRVDGASATGDWSAGGSTGQPDSGTNEAIMFHSHSSSSGSAGGQNFLDNPLAPELLLAVQSSPGGTWTLDKTLAIPAPSGGTLTGQTTAGFSLTEPADTPAVTPEPASLLLFSLGALLIAASNLKRRLDLRKRA